MQCRACRISSIAATHRLAGTHTAGLTTRCVVALPHQSHPPRAARRRAPWLYPFFASCQSTHSPGSYRGNATAKAGRRAIPCTSCLAAHSNPVACQSVQCSSDCQDVMHVPDIPSYLSVCSTRRSLEARCAAGSAVTPVTKPLTAQAVPVASRCDCGKRKDKPSSLKGSLKGCKKDEEYPENGSPPFNASFLACYHNLSVDSQMPLTASLWGVLLV